MIHSVPTAVCLGVILYFGYPGLAGAVCTAEKFAAGLSTVPDDFAAAMITNRREPMDRALEAVESMTTAGCDNFERQIIIVATHFTLRHSIAPFCSGFR
jgi:hypothetical protein